MTRVFIASSDSNSYFTGDTVAYSSAGIAGSITLPASGTTSPSVLGVFVGCEYYDTGTGRQVFSPYFPGSVGSSSPCNAYVITDPDQLFIVQSSTTSLIGSSNTGYNVGIASSLQASGNTLSGISGLALNSSTVSANSSLPFRIVDSYANYAPPGVNGTDTTAAGQILVVAPNNWARKNLTAPST
jgi:hypothetical protein